jgi:hypothetical protein
VLDIDDSLVMGGESAFHRDVRFGVSGIDMQLFDSVWKGRREMENTGVSVRKGSYNPRIKVQRETWQEREMKLVSVAR